MSSIRGEHGRLKYGVQDLVFDKEADLASFYRPTIQPGSTAFVLESSARYMLNNSRQWVKIASSSASAGGSSSGGSSSGGSCGCCPGSGPGSGSEDDIPIEENYWIIYDGGNLDEED